MSDLGAFLDAELNYYDRCREILLQLKRDWPGESVTCPSTVESLLTGEQTKRKQQQREPSKPSITVKHGPYVS